MNPKIAQLSEQELINLYLASMRHCANVVLIHVAGSDDSQDYVESATDIMKELNDAFRDTDTGDVPYIVLRDSLSSMMENTYDRYASDAVPSEWEVFIDGK